MANLITEYTVLGSSAPQGELIPETFWGEAIGRNWYDLLRGGGFSHFSYAPIQVETAYVSAEGVIPAINALRAEIAGVRTALAQQQGLMEKILAAVGGGPEIEIEEIGDDEARTRIIELFSGSNGALFYDEIAERLRLPLRQTVEICNQLELEGLIAEPATKQ